MWENKMKKIVVLLMALLFLAGCSRTGTDDDPIRVAITIKDQGTMEAELYPEVAPVTVANFVSLAEDGFYDGKTFHRMIDGFMIQGGADLEGMIKPIKGEFTANGVKNDLKHTAGVLSMARRNGDNDSATSQFFIMVDDAPHLDGKYAAFGKVVDGLDIALRLAKEARPIDNNGMIAPEDQPVIESIRVIK